MHFDIFSLPTTEMQPCYEILRRYSITTTRGSESKLEGVRVMMRVAVRDNGEGRGVMVRDGCVKTNTESFRLISCLMIYPRNFFV